MRNIILLGFVSFFIDTSTEMVYPIVPLYLTTVLGATPALVGLIEGIAESLASLLKVFSGYVTDKYKKKKPLAFAGYSTALIYKVALILSTSWFGVLTARVIDRFGKGIRTVPRDVLVSEGVDKKDIGKAFGLHKMLDMAGAALGILIAYLLMVTSKGEYNFKRIFLLSMIPAVIGLTLILFVREAREAKEQKIVKFSLEFSKLDRKLKLFLVMIFVFTLGNSSNAFLLLRAQNVGFDSTTVILLYFIYNIVSSALALPFGKLSDKLGRRKLLVTGYAIFGLVYLGFAIPLNKLTIAILFALYGLYTAATAGVERALIVEIAPKELKGTALGLYSALVGIALLPASIIAGLLWDNVSPAAPFLCGSILAFTTAIAVSIILRDRKESLVNTRML